MNAFLLRLVPLALAASVFSAPAQGQGHGGSGGGGNGNAGGSSGGVGGGGHGGAVADGGSRGSGSYGGSFSRGNSFGSARGGYAAGGRRTGQTIFSPSNPEPRISANGGYRGGYRGFSRGNGLPRGGYGFGFGDGRWPYQSRDSFSYGRGRFYPYLAYGFGGYPSSYYDGADYGSTFIGSGYNGYNGGPFVLTNPPNEAPAPTGQPPPGYQASPQRTALPPRRPTAYPGEDPGKRESSPIVLEAQRRLAQRGYFAGPADGNFGDDTSLALARFQSDASRPITGRIDNGTLDALRR